MRAEACGHEAWEVTGGARRCSDCRTVLPAASVVQGDEGLREAIARGIWDSEMGCGEGCTAPIHPEDLLREALEISVVASVGSQVPAGWVWRQDKVVDAVLALPEVRQLAADAAAVKRVWEDEPLRSVLLRHHPIAHTTTGMLKGCRCGQVGLGQDVIAHVADRVRRALDGGDQ